MLKRHQRKNGSDNWRGKNTSFINNKQRLWRKIILQLFEDAPGCESRQKRYEITDDGCISDRQTWFRGPQRRIYSV